MTLSIVEEKWQNFLLQYLVSSHKLSNFYYKKISYFTSVLCKKVKLLYKRNKWSISRYNQGLTRTRKNTKIRVVPVSCLDTTRTRHESFVKVPGYNTSISVTEKTQSRFRTKKKHSPKNAPKNTVFCTNKKVSTNFLFRVVIFIKKFNII